MSAHWDADLDLPGFDQLVSTVRLFAGRHGRRHLDHSAHHLDHNEALHEKPFLRCAVVGPPYSGKARAVRKLAEALGSSRALYVDATKLVPGSVESAAVELVLQNALETQEPRYLFISNIHREHALGSADGEACPVYAAEDPRAADATSPGSCDQERERDLNDVLRLLRELPGEESSGGIPPSEQHRHPEQRRAARSMQQREASSGGSHRREQISAVATISKRIAQERLPVLLFTTSDLPPQVSTESGPPVVDLIYSSGLPRTRALHQIWEQALSTVPVDDTVRMDELVYFSKGYTAREVRAAVTTALHRAALSAAGHSDGLQIGQLDLLTALPRQPITFRMWAQGPEVRSIRGPRLGMGESRRPSHRAALRLSDPRDEQLASRGSALRESMLDAAIDAAMVEIRNKWN